VGYFNIHFRLGLPELFFNKHTEIAVIVLYGIPRILMTRDPFQRKRLAVMVGLVFTVWYLIPTLWPVTVDWFGFNRPWAATFPSFDVPGTWTMVALTVAGLLFGRRVKCGWMNTCVAMRETAGAPFRGATKRGVEWHQWRYLKALTGVLFFSYFAVIFLPPSRFTELYFYWFWTILVVGYFASLFLSPWLGSRAWCRWVCPIFGWVNTLGFYRLCVDRAKCTECGTCEKVCDFGVPIRELSKRNPQIRTSECMGCGRCRSACPRQAISYRDVRDYLREKLAKTRPEEKPAAPPPASEQASGLAAGKRRSET
jgi:polyferredoxin